MEHGAVVIWLKDATEPRTQAVLDALRPVVAAGYEALIVVPYPESRTPIAITAWGSLQRCRDVSAAAITDFVERYYASGIEGSLACAVSAAARRTPPCVERLASPSPDPTAVSAGRASRRERAEVVDERHEGVELDVGDLGPLTVAVDHGEGLAPGIQRDARARRCECDSALRAAHHKVRGVSCDSRLEVLGQDRDDLDIGSQPGHRRRDDLPVGTRLVRDDDPDALHA
jgi:hypothetical protein